MSFPRAWLGAPGCLRLHLDDPNENTICAPADLYRMRIVCLRARHDPAPAFDHAGGCRRHWQFRKPLRHDSRHRLRGLLNAVV